MYKLFIQSNNTLTYKSYFLIVMKRNLFIP